MLSLQVFFFVVVYCCYGSHPTNQRIIYCNEEINNGRCDSRSQYSWNLHRINYAMNIVYSFYVWQWASKSLYYHSRNCFRKAIDYMDTLLSAWGVSITFQTLLTISWNFANTPAKRFKRAKMLSNTTSTFTLEFSICTYYYKKQQEHKIAPACRWLGRKWLIHCSLLNFR